MIEKPGSIKIFETEKPKIESDEDVIIKVEACGVCGTDIHMFSGLGFARYPVIPGHEFVGRISDLGDRAKKSFKVGERAVADPNLSCFYCEPCRKGAINLCEGNMINQGVNINGAYAEYARINMKQCYIVSDTIPKEIAVLAEPVSCITHAIDRSCVKSTESVLIFGAGSIGVLMYKILNGIYGVSDIDIIEINDKRIETAKSIGIKRISRNLGEKKYDLVFEASGSCKAFESGIIALKPLGRLVQFGVANEKINVSINQYEIYKKELTILGSFVNPFTMDRALKILNDHQNVFTHIVNKVVNINEVENVLNGKISSDSFLKAMLVF